MSDLPRPPGDWDPATVEAHPIRSGLVLLIVAGVSTLCGWVLALPAVVLAAMSMGDRSSSARSERLVRWGWIAYAIAMSLFVVAAVILMGIATLGASGNN